MVEKTKKKKSNKKQFIKDCLCKRYAVSYRFKGYLTREWITKNLWKLRRKILELEFDRISTPFVCVSFQLPKMQKETNQANQKVNMKVSLILLKS